VQLLLPPSSELRCTFEITIRTTDFGLARVPPRRLPTLSSRAEGSGRIARGTDLRASLDHVCDWSSMARSWGPPHVTVLPTDGEAMLVRPDGHLAWRGAPVPDALDARLTGILGA